jgi:hypothetical protein
MKWGTLYGPHYVDRLYAMVNRHLSRPFRFVCFTDDAEGIRQEVECLPMPPITLTEKYKNHPWRKIGLFNPTLGDLSGTTLFLDLDLVIVDSIDPLFDYEPSRFCIIHNWTHPDRITGNSSVYRFEVGADSYVLDRFYTESHEHWIAEYGNSQTFLSNSVKDMAYWPAEWCVSFKKHCLPGGPFGLFNMLKRSRVPEGARVVVFHGHPNPDDALAGRWPGGIHKQLRPATWVADHWQA